MTDAYGLFIEECKRCQLDPLKCHDSSMYQKTRDIVQIASKQGIHVDTQGMTCFEIYKFIMEKIEKVKQ